MLASSKGLNEHTGKPTVGDKIFRVLVALFNVIK